jgi:hypothetical protein
MMEPRQWHEDGATEVERELLRAAHADGPRKGADLRMLAAIEAAPPPLNPMRLGRWGKIGLAAMIAGGGGLMAHQLLRPQAAAPTNSPSVLAVSSEVGAPVRRAVDPEVDDNTESTLTMEKPVATGESPARVRRPSGSGRAREAVARPVDNPGEDSLGEETKALDRTREALEARRTSEVMRLLEDYHRKFPQGRLRPEAMVLRLAGLVQAGKNGAAETLANQLMADEVYRPYLTKIESLLKDVK